jgi:hypothetical protein
VTGVQTCALPIFVRTRVVSGFIFLRLLCPAILHPRQFNLISGEFLIWKLEKVHIEEFSDLYSSNPIINIENWFRNIVHFLDFHMITVDWHQEMVDAIIANKTVRNSNAFKFRSFQSLQP